MLTRRQALKFATSCGAVLAGGILSGCTISVFSDSAGDSSASGVRTLDDIVAANLLRVGIMSDLKPYSYVDDLGIYQGFDVELARRVSQDLGVGLEFVNVDAASRIMYLDSGKIDIMLSSFTQSESRKKKIDFAEAYMQVTTAILSHVEHPLTDMADIGDRPIILTSGASAEVTIAELCPEATLERYDSFVMARMAFENNPEALWSSDVTDFVAQCREDPGKYVLGIESVGDTLFVSPALAKDNTELLGWLNEELVALGSERFFHKNYEETMLEAYGAEYEEVFIIEPGQD